MSGTISFVHNWFWRSNWSYLAANWSGIKRQIEYEIDSTIFVFMCRGCHGDDVGGGTSRSSAGTNITIVASEYLLSNWRVFFHAIDVNHDNVLNKKDFADNRERYIYLATQRGELDHSLLEKLDRWWTDDVFKGDLNLQMTEKQYVDFMNSMYVADKEAFEAFGKETIIKVWEFLNLNSDKYISWEEFGVAETVFGHPTYARDYAGYLAFKPVLMAPLSRFIEAWTDVAIDDDEAGPRIVKDTFMKDGFE